LSEALKPRRPYLLRAMHEWITDNKQTPHIVVDAGVDGVLVPQEHVKDGKIVLNLSYSAISDLIIGNEVLEFGARFGGVPFTVEVPVEAVMGIYARETGQGMIFGSEEPEPEPPPKGSEGARPQLRVVK
jgi:stringent starvation protein B